MCRARAAEGADVNADGKQAQGRWTVVLVAVALALVAVGYFTGTAPPVARPRREAPVQPAQGDVRKAPSYKQLRLAGATPPPAEPSELRRHEWPALTSDPLRPVDPALADRPLAQKKRSELRAFDGAPPTVPHAVPQGGLVACASCHAEGLLLGARPVPRLSHDLYTGCTQCHVPKDPPMPREMAMLPQSVADSDFAGLAALPQGDRAWPGAPPTIPHTTWMRGQCAACHGDSGQKGLQSSHPWRTSCQQCHPPAAALDQGPALLATGAER